MKRTVWNLYCQDHGFWFSIETRGNCPKCGAYYEARHWSLQTVETLTQVISRDEYRAARFTYVLRGLPSDPETLAWAAEAGLGAKAAAIAVAERNR